MKKIKSFLILALTVFAVGCCNIQTQAHEKVSLEGQVMKHRDNQIVETIEADKSETIKPGETVHIKHEISKRGTDRKGGFIFLFYTNTDADKEEMKHGIVVDSIRIVSNQNGNLKHSVEAYPFNEGYKKDSESKYLDYQTLYYMIVRDCCYKEGEIYTLEYDVYVEGITRYGEVGISSKVMDEETKNNEKDVTEIDHAFIFKIANEVSITGTTDEDPSKPLTGQSIEVFNYHDEKIYEGIFDEEGICKVKGLDAGEYHFKQKTANAGYCKDTTYHYFNVDERGNVSGETSIINKKKHIIFSFYNYDTNELIETITEEAAAYENCSDYYEIFKDRYLNQNLYFKLTHSVIDITGTRDIKVSIYYTKEHYQHTVTITYKDIDTDEILKRVTKKFDDNAIYNLEDDANVTFKGYTAVPTSLDYSGAVINNNHSYSFYYKKDTEHDSSITEEKELTKEEEVLDKEEQIIEEEKNSEVIIEDKNEETQKVIDEPVQTGDTSFTQLYLALAIMLLIMLFIMIMLYLI